MTRFSALRRYSGLALVVFVLVLAGCDKQAATTHPDRPLPRILLVGIDGMDWSVLLPLVQQGRTPVLRSLMEQGAFGQLESVVPTLSPAIWTTIATGKTIDKHGITGFWFPDPENPSIQRHYTSAERRTKAFWNILSDHGRRVHTVGWFVTYPVEAINGVMVSQTNTMPREGAARRGEAIAKGGLIEGAEGQVFPPERTAEIMDALRESDEALPTLTRRVFGEFRHPLDPLGENLWQHSHWAFRADATYARIAKQLAAEEPPFDLLAVYFGGPDVVGHRFWRYMEPGRFTHKPSAEEIENFGRVIPDYYVYMDGVIGELLRATPPPVTVIVVADHGMEPTNTDRQFHPHSYGNESWSGGHLDATPGVFVAAGPGIRGSPLGASIDALVPSDLPHVGSVFDVAPTLLALLNAPVGADMDGDVMTGMIEPSHLAAFPVRRIETHDTPQWLASRPRRVEPPDAAERTEQLRSLGYIE
jgi:hypothetical protein